MIISDSDEQNDEIKSDKEKIKELLARNEELVESNRKLKAVSIFIVI